MQKISKEHFSEIATGAGAICAGALAIAFYTLPPEMPYTSEGQVCDVNNEQSNVDPNCAHATAIIDERKNDLSSAISLGILAGALGVTSMRIVNRRIVGKTNLEFNQIVKNFNAY